MVDVDISADEVVLRPRGLHRLWTFRQEVRIPLAQLKSVEAGVSPEARTQRRRSLRLPGTSLPCLITAGSYRARGRWSFWDVVGDGQSALTLSTEGHHYAELIVDVTDPGLTLAALRRAIHMA
ncbi:MAG: hypothetical protein ACLQIH_06780 [Myxococcaceae bacterium]